MRDLLRWSLVLFQLVTPALCHEHRADSAQTFRASGPHLHAHRLPFWPVDHDEHDENGDDDHDADAVYVPDGVIVGTAPEPVGPLQAFFPAPSGASWPALTPISDAPDPVAHPPPSRAAFFPDRPVYRATLALLI